jgi:hypothetical protein
MSRRAVFRWIGLSATFLLVLTAAFLPMLFLFASTPLHDGDELPGPLLLSATTVASAALALFVAWLVRRRLRTLATPERGDVET